MRTNVVRAQRHPRVTFVPVAGSVLLLMVAHLLLMSTVSHAAASQFGAVAVPSTPAAHAGEYHHRTPEAPSDDAGCDVVMAVVSVQAPGTMDDVKAPGPLTEWLVPPGTLTVATASGAARADPLVLQRAFLQIYRV